MHRFADIEQRSGRSPSCDEAGSGQARAGDWRWWVAAGAIIALGAGVRLGAARGDLWLDEIWSLELARYVPSVGAVFTGLHHDNNHHLNTLYLLLVGEGASGLTYRLPAVLAGAAAVALVALPPPRAGSAETFAWSVFIAFSYVLVHYSSEARGYGLAVFFAVAAFLSMDRYLATRRWRWALLFAASGTLGVLSHATFLYALLAFAAWGAVAVIAAGRARRGDLVLLACAGTPLLAFAALWLFDLRYLAIGGGPAWQTWDVLRELLRVTLGLPRGPFELLGLAAVVAAAYEIFRMARERRTEWAFFLTVLLVAPALLLVWRRPEYLAPRYFLVAVPFFLLVVASALARCFRQGAGGKAVYVLGLALFCGASGAHIARLLQQGRGQYREALTFMLRNTPGRPVTVGSDHDWRNPVVLAYYARQVPGSEALLYLTADQWSDHAPVWFLRHDFSEAPQLEPRLVGPNGRPYVLVRHFPYAGLSGWHWFLYRMSEAP